MSKPSDGNAGGQADPGADVRDHPLAGDHREGDPGVEHNQVTFRVPLEATKPEIKAAVEGLFKVKVKAVNTLRQEGKKKRLPRPARPAQRLQEGDRDAGRGPDHRRDDGSLMAMALKTFKPTTPGQRQLVIVDRSELHKGKPVKTLTEGLRARAAATTTAASPCAGAAAVTSAPTASSTSSAASST